MANRINYKPLPKRISGSGGPTTLILSVSSIELPARHSPPTFRHIGGLISPWWRESHVGQNSCRPYGSVRLFSVIRYAHFTSISSAN